MRSKAATGEILRAGWMSPIAVACLLLVATACDGRAETRGADAERAAESAPVSSPAQAVEQFEVTVDPSALPSAPLDRQAFVDDACRFANAEQIASFFTFHDGPVTVEGGDGFYAGTECSYAMQDPEVFLEVHFAQVLASSTEEVEIAGLVGVLRDVSGSTLENRARVQIPFRIEGSAAEVATIQFHVRGVPPADEETLREAIDALGTNLIERLSLAVEQ